MIPFRMTASTHPDVSYPADSLLHDSLTSKTPIYFPVNSSEVIPDYEGNKSTLQHLDGQLEKVMSDSTISLRRLTIHGYGSIDGPYSYNDSIAQERTKSLADYVKHRSNISDDIITTLSTPEDWQGLKSFIENTTLEQMPHKHEILKIVNSSRELDAKGWLIKSDYPEDYDYLLEHCMPHLRRAYYTINYDKPLNNSIVRKASIMPEVSTAAVFTKDTTAVSTQEEPKSRSFIFALKTNLLYDAALIPNVGIEVYMGKRWTVALDWFYTWFSSNHRHRYWQAYGGYLGVRKYLGGNNNSKFKIQNSKFPTGHHLGAYVLGLTYDVEWGGKGYQAAKFGFGGGLEYGYSKMIGRRWSIDFSVGVGFQDGEYKEYEPANDGTGHYIWLATKKRHWWGPTKAEVSLKWLLGN